MARVTSKRQVTIPKAIADRYDIEPGDEIEFLAAGDGIRVQTSAARSGVLDRDRRLELFDQATARQQERQKTRRRRGRGRGWRREELYERAGAR